MAGLIYLDAENWRYENAGTADTLIVSGTTLTNLPRTQSQTKTAFYQPTRAKCFDLPATAEIWMKLDVYFDGSNRWRAYNGGSNGVTGITAQTNGNVSFFSNESNVREQTGICKKNQLQTVLLHMVTGASGGIVEAWIDGNFIYRYTGNVNRGEDFADIYLQSDGSGTFFSNVIISNVEIGLDENVDMPFGVPAIKPEIFISWIPTGKICFKPQLYATIIQAPIHEKISADLNRKISKPESTSGDLQLKIGNGEEVSADVSRHVISTDTVTADTLRKLFVEENISGNTLIKIVQSAEIHADTSREVQSTEKIIGDTARKIGVTTASADLHRKIIVSTKNPADTRRQVAVEETASSDVFLRTICAETVLADTCRKVEDSTPTVAKVDTNRQIGVREKFSANTRRLIAQKEKASADTFLQTRAIEKVSADTMRGLREVFRADTCRKITRAEKEIARTVIRVPHVLNYTLQSKPQTLKSSKKLLADNPLSLINTFKDYGVTAINITLSEKTLSDNFTFDIASRSMDINEAVQGWLLDYPFSFLVEETNQTEQTQSVKGRYSIDDLIYTWFYIPTARMTVDGKEFEVPGGRIEKGSNGAYVFLYPTASEIAIKVAQYFGMLPVLLFDDFTPSNLSGDQAVTYADLLNSVFGWTSKLPHYQINVFIRGGVLYFVQRGKERGVFDITDLQHSRPTINKKFNRVLCYNPNNKDDTGNDDDDTGKLFSGVIEYAGQHFDLRYEYADGFLRKEYQHINTGGDVFMSDSTGILHPFSGISKDTEWTTATATNSTTYTYVKYSDISKSDEERNEAKTQVQQENLYERYVSTKEEKNTSIQTHGTGYDIEDSTKVETRTVTQYHYSQIKDDTSENPEIYLVAEIETAHVTEYEIAADSEIHAGWKKASDETHIKKTFHVPVGNGWYGQTVFLDGAFQGANLSQGKPGNRVSPYVVKNFGGNRVESGTDDEPPTTNPLGELSWIEDSSIPVRDSGLQYALNSALRWLHRKIEETVTVDLISKIVDGVPEMNHIVDFTERVKFNGAEYFLVSNQISFTPRKLIQKLTLIRWY